MRTFNTRGLCLPHKHYMVNISDRVAQIRAMVEKGDYLCINRGRQYGKTTMLAALSASLADAYEVVRLDFQALSEADFATEGDFVRAFSYILLDEHSIGTVDIPDEVVDSLVSLTRLNTGLVRLSDVFRVLTRWHHMSERPLVLIIDEMDSATNNQVFLDFLARLRLQYLRRAEMPSYPAFQSVILAGVTDIRHLRSKIRDEDQHRLNSPWNIAANFDVDMSFNCADVTGMLRDYEADHALSMDIPTVATQIVTWTGGYPFLVSRICQIVDEGGLSWDRNGVDAAIRIVLGESNALFASLVGKLNAYPQLRASLHAMLMEGERLEYNLNQDDIAQLQMYGFIRNVNGSVQIANRIFETVLYNLFLSDEEVRGNRFHKAGDLGRNIFVEEGSLNMRAVLEGFRRTYVEIYGPLEEGSRFYERDGRELFLMYLKPIINGTGNYYIEAQTRDQTRTDVIVDYAGERFVVELKIWRGPRYNEAGERQVASYLDHFGLSVGYMLSFNFNQNKEPGLRRMVMDGRVLWEETV